MGLCLLIDTSIFGAGMAVLDNKQPFNRLWHATIAKKNASASLLTSLWQKASVELKIQGKDIKKIAISTGPGSFTGIKVGLSWTYGFAAGDTKILWSELSALASASNELYKRKTTAKTVICVPTTKTHGFIAYKNGDESKASCSLINTKDMLTSFGPFTNLTENAGVYWAGDWPLLQSQCPSLGVFQEALPMEQLLNLGIEGMISGIQNNDITWSNKIPSPNYMRLSTAEENLVDKQRVQK